MTRITLLRHAKSESYSSGKKDFDRKLNTRGENDASAVGKFCSSRISLPDLVLLSPSCRTQQTVDLFFSSWLEKPGNTTKADNLYLADLKDYIHVLEEYSNNDLNHILICSHQPGTEIFAGWLVPEFSYDVPTCTIISIMLKENEISEGTGLLDLYITPKMLK